MALSNIMPDASLYVNTTTTMNTTTTTTTTITVNNSTSPYTFLNNSITPLTVLSIYDSHIHYTPFLPNEFPFKETNAISPQQQAQDSMVRIVVALNGVEGLTGAEGPLPAILAFDENQKYIGASDWGSKFATIPSGADADIWVSQKKAPGRQATYLQILGHNDGICIAYISQLWGDWTTRGWLGDMGQACAKRFYYSNIIVGANGHRPYCTWLNKDGARDGTDKLLHNEAAAMQIHMEAFANTTVNPTTDPSYYCHEPSLIFRRAYNYKLKHEDYELDYLPDSGRVHFWREKNKDTIPRRRRQRSPPHPPTQSPPLSPSSRFSGRLITSPHSTHRASSLCSNPNAWGPDFVSYAEKMYCDMETREQWPLCEGDGNGEGGEEGQIKDECYDMATHSLLTKSRLVKRNHVRVEEWS